MATEENRNKKPGRQPDYRIVQVVKDPFVVEKTGKESNYKHVGAIWAGKSEKGEEYLSIRIGDLELVGFVNKPPANQTKLN